MLLEDQLRKVVGKSSGKSFKFYDNKNLPRSQHSCFGDFPKDYLPAKKSSVIPLPTTKELESSIAVGGHNTKGKSLAFAQARARPAPPARTVGRCRRRPAHRRP